MPNTFAGQVLKDPRKIRQRRPRFKRDRIPELDYANSIYVAAAEHAPRGWILLDRAGWNAINNSAAGIYGTNFALNIDECIASQFSSSQQIILQNLAIVQARCVTFGIASAANVIFLLEITDARGILKNRWFDFPINKNYNSLAPAYPTLSY